MPLPMDALYGNDQVRFDVAIAALPLTSKC